MKVVVLCGGQGTRIRDVDWNLPKAMVPIGDKPILWHILKGYADFGLTNFVLCAGYKGYAIREYVNALEEDWSIEYVDTGLSNMTGSRLHQIKPLVDATFCLTYGDGVSNIDLDQELAFHKAHGKLLTFSAVKPPSRFGELIFDDKGSVKSFDEKPLDVAGRISGGFFICEPGVFDYVTSDVNCIFEQGPLQAIVKDGQAMAYQHDGFWHAMDNHRDYERLNAMFAKNQCLWNKGVIPA